jgi:hypothetical protein
MDETWQLQPPAFEPGTALGLGDAALRELLDCCYGTGWVLLQVGDGLASVELVAGNGSSYELGAVAGRLVREDARRHGARSAAAMKRRATACA